MSSTAIGESFLQQLGHPTERPMLRPLGRLRTSSRYTTQPVILTRPIEGIADVPVKCDVCQQEIIIQVASRKHIQAFRLRWGVMIGIFFVITVALLYGSYQSPAGSDLAQSLQAFSILPALGSFLCVVRIFKEGITIKQQPRGARHQLFKSDPQKKIVPKKNSLARRGKQ